MKYLNNWGSFILESLILESKVVYSSKLKKVLSKMDNFIAKNLLEIEDKDLDVISNFFDIKPDNAETLTFTTDRVAQSILDSEVEYVVYTGGRGGWLTNNVEANAVVFAALGFVPKTVEVFQPNGTDPGEVISKYTSERTGKTWCYVKFPGGEGVYNIDKLREHVIDKKSLVFTKSRQDIRTGRVVRMLLNLNGITFTDSDIESFVNDFRAAFAIINDVFSRFEIVEGEDLLYWYNRMRYEFPHMGNLGSSCQAIGRRDWLEIYIENPQTVKLLILKSENTDEKIVGRALLWNLDDGRVLMDHIYTSKDSDNKVFKEYADSKGYVKFNYADTYFAHIKPTEFDEYPSIDNMRYWSPVDGKISNKRFTGSQEIYWTGEEEEEDWDDWDDDY